MNTGEWITVIHKNGFHGREPCLWCDICGWGDTVGGYPDDPYHFCHRHKSHEIKAFMDGRLMGYFEGQQDLL